MIIFMDGFDQWRDSVNPALTMVESGYTVSGNVTVDEGRVSAQRSVRIGNNDNKAAHIARSFRSENSKVVIAFAYKAQLTRSPIVTIKNVGTLNWDPVTGKVSIAGGSGTATILLDLWYYFEIIIDKIGHKIDVYVNNGLDIEAVLPSSAQYLTDYLCTWDAGLNDIKYLDDLVFIDNSEGKYIDRIGPVKITSRLPSVDVDTEWSPSTGIAHWPLVDNQPPVEGEYIQSNVSGATDTFLSNTPVPTDGAVLAVGMTVLCRKSDIDARQLGMVVGQVGSPQTEVLDTELSLTDKYSYAVFERAPNSVNWTAENVTTTPFGVVVRP